RALCSLWGTISHWESFTVASAFLAGGVAPRSTVVLLESSDGGVREEVGKLSLLNVGAAERKLSLAARAIVLTHFDSGTEPPASESKSRAVRKDSARSRAVGNRASGSRAQASMNHSSKPGGTGTTSLGTGIFRLQIRQSKSHK